MATDRQQARPEHLQQKQTRCRAALRIGVVVGWALLMAACAGGGDDGLPRGGYYKVGAPYQIKGVWYYPKEDYDYDETGIASWYGPGFHQLKTANGEIFDQNEVTAAHKTLPMPCLARVDNLDNGRSLVVRINDRGPFAHGRIIDLSRRAAQLLGYEQKGTAKVRVAILADESRAIAAAARANTPTHISAAESGPSPVAAAPRARVEVEGGARPTRPTYSPPAPRPARIEPPRTVAGSVADDGRFLPAPVASQRSAYGAHHIYVQAGAYESYDNANRVRARLSGMGAKMSQAMVGNARLFRVRIGPMASVETADQALNRVIAAGNPEARVVVD